MEKKHIALVTGGSRGIGKAICKELAQKSYHIIINYRSNKDAALDTLKEIEENGGSAELLAFDVADYQSVEQALNNWKEANSEKVIDVLVNNAGINHDTLFVWMEKEQWDKVINTNLNGVYNTSRVLIQDMIMNKWGRIVNIVSLSGQKGQAGQVNYSASKAGIIGATKSLALEVGKKKITVNAVAPGFIDTDMVAELDQKMLKKLIPANRFGKAEEVASLVGFLASDKAAYITGEVISINGGLYT